MSQETIFLLILVLLGFVSKNNSVLIAAAFLLCIRLASLGTIAFPWLKDHGINLGVIIITIAVLTPIATGEIRLQEIYTTIDNPHGWIVILAGLGVAVLGGMGLQLLHSDPHMTVGLVIGTIAGVLLFKGIPVGPLIGAGIAVLLIKLYELIKFW